MKRLIQVLFGCLHRRTTRAFVRAGSGEHYLVCLDCGKEIPYDWSAMRRIA